MALRERNIREMPTTEKVEFDKLVRKLVNEMKQTREHLNKIGSALKPESKFLMTVK